MEGSEQTERARAVWSAGDYDSMFAPDHALSAAEIARVLRPGGRLGVAAWSPDGSIGDFFRSLAALGPPPPPDFQPPILWGVRDTSARS